MYSPIGLIQYSQCWRKFYPHMRIRGMISHKKFGTLFPAGGRIDIEKQNTNAYSRDLPHLTIHPTINSWNEITCLYMNPCFRSIKHQANINNISV